jgi:hypothetical protein
MLLRTSETNADGLSRQMLNWDARVGKRMRDLEGEGSPRDRAHTIAVKEAAQELGMALYVYDKGTFRKVR